MEMESCEPSRCLDFLSLDDLHQEIRRRDAAASSGSNYGRGMTLVLDDKGKKYIRFLTWAQVWTMFTDNNPGTVDAYGDLKDDSLDIGLRRVRFLSYSQLTEKYLILVHVGINNQTFTNGGGSGSAGVGPYGAGKKPQIFFHDVWNEYAVIPPSECSDFSLAMGAGLLYWNGISRKSSSSTSSYMTVDSPIFCWPNIEFSDEFARQLGWYAKGKFHKLDYRFSVTQPFNADDRKRVLRPDRPPLNSERAVNIAAHSLAFAGYFDWEFWDQESNLLPYKTSSWLGEKSVFNIGAGFYYHPDSSGILDADGQLEKARSVGRGHRLLLRQTGRQLRRRPDHVRRVLHLRLWRQLLPEHRDHEHGPIGPAGLSWQRQESRPRSAARAMLNPSWERAKSFTWKAAMCCRLGCWANRTAACSHSGPSPTRTWLGWMIRRSTGTWASTT